MSVYSVKLLKKTAEKVFGKCIATISQCPDMSLIIFESDITGFSMETLETFKQELGGKNFHVIYWSQNKPRKQWLQIEVRDNEV